MVFRILRLTRHAGWLALLGACATVSACSNNPPPVPQAFIAATVGVGPMSDSRVCNFATLDQWLDVGTGVGSKTPDTQTDGSNQGGAKISVACTVSASGSGFDIDLSVTQDGTQGGSVTITSPGGTGAVTQNGGTGITGVFESATNGRYRETDCTIAFTYMGQPVATPGGPLAAGRIWGHLSCPTAQVSGQTVTVDGGTQDVQCDAEADFLFEQCGL